MSAFRIGLVVAATLAMPAYAQTSTSPGPGSAGSARPARGPEQNSLGSPPPASTTTTTGTANQSPAVQQMNNEGRQKVETEGK